MTRAALVSALLLAGCSRGTGGRLKPVVEPGVEVSADARGDRAAMVHADAVSVRLTARWSDTGGQSAMLVHANRGRTPIHIDLGTLTATGLAGVAVPF